MFDDDTEEVRNFKMMLFVGLLFAVAFVACSCFIDIFSKGESSKPPSVDIQRSGYNVSVRYLGGIDTAFVGDFRIYHDDTFTQFRNPGDHGFVGNVTSKSCVRVYAIDRATLYWRPIGYEYGNCTQPLKTVI